MTVMDVMKDKEWDKAMSGGAKMEEMQRKMAQKIQASKVK